MPRAKRGFKARRRRNRILKVAKGFRGSRSKNFRRALEAVHHAWMHMYTSRKGLKRILLGSEALAVLTHSEVPVLILR